MGTRIEIASIDRSRQGMLEAHPLERVTLVEVEDGEVGSFRTWWGEEITVSYTDREMLRLDLTGMRSLREAITGKKGDRRFIRTLDCDRQQISNELLILCTRI